MDTKQVDILIIGGGLIGATLVLALNTLGYSTLVVDSQTLDSKIKPEFDERSLALSPASVKILHMLGLWDKVKDSACPIEKIHVSELGRFGMSRLKAPSSNPLGYVVTMHALNLALQGALEKTTLLNPATLTGLDLENSVAYVTTHQGALQIKTQLIVAADGAQSSLRELAKLPSATKHYQQVAIVANIGLDKPHEQCAFERFTPQGPLALLPMQGNKMSLVWAMSPEEASIKMNTTEAEFLKALQLAFGYRVGRFVKLGQRASFPLKQVTMPQLAKWPLVFIGNAAQTLHPVAGQGFNLGLRDVATLAQCVASKGLNAQMVAHYLDLRRHDQQTIVHFTDGLIKLFTSRLPGIGLLRNLGLIAFDNNPALKNLMKRYAGGFGGVIPDLVCELALRRTHDPVL